RKLGAVSSPTREPPAGAHRPHGGIGEEAVTVACVRGPAPLRREGLDRLTQKLARLVAEEGLGLLVDVHDPPPLIDDHQPVRRRLQQLVAYLWIEFWRHLPLAGRSVHRQLLEPLRYPATMAGSVCVSIGLGM